ncbi:MerR family transcriptional regulator [Micromonospora peucetia]|uniref:MerR family transcriptional regulator n=1 Tax=Micromonospora peucetia TaxID=47871 RepID=UPI003320A273
MGEIAAATGVTPRLLRYYEEQGLLTPARSAAGQRLYAAGDIDQVTRIRRLLDAGLSTAVIAQILTCVCGGTEDVEPCLDPLLREELTRVDARLAHITQHRERLAAIVNREQPPGTSAPVAHDPALLLRVTR